MKSTPTTSQPKRSPPTQDFKTLVARAERNGIAMAVIPGNQKLNLKTLAAAANERKIQPVPFRAL
jgi:prolyl-tRNA editing enzyme YbaK/EbsC (Cys-tRNA(Pro) deacylase)